MADVRTNNTANVTIYDEAGSQFGTTANPLFQIVKNSLVPAAYDYISLGYTGNNITTVVYRTGGAAGTIVATLTLGYTGSTLTSVTKT